MRLFFKVLSKNARIESSQSSFSKMPTSAAIYMIHTWLVKIFGEEAEKEQTMIKDKAKLSKKKAISMKSVNVENRLSKRYIAKQ